MPEQNSHIALVQHDRVPASLLDEFCARVNADSLNFERISRPEPRPLAGIEWLAFPAIAVFILKPYFEGFMKEAGKNHYLVLNKALKALWGKLFSNDRSFRVAIVTASGEKTLEYSMLFAVYATVDNGRLMKLLIREDCSEDEYSASIDAFLNFIESYHSRNPGEQQAIDRDRKSGSVTLVEYDGKSKSLRIVNPSADLGDRRSDDN